MNIGIEIAVPMISRMYGKCQVCIGIHKRSSDPYVFLEIAIYGMCQLISTMDFATAFPRRFPWFASWKKLKSWIVL